MLKILVVVLMAGVMENGGRDLYVFTTPTFENIESCNQWASTNPEQVIWTVAQSYGQRPIEMVYCVDEEQVKKTVPGYDPDSYVPPVDGTAIQFSNLVDTDAFLCYINNMELLLGIISVLFGTVLLGYSVSMPIDHEWYDLVLMFGAFFLVTPILISRN